MCAYETCEPKFLIPETGTLFPFIHECPLKIHTQNTGTSWNCDMRHKFGKCFSGLTDFYQASNLYGLQCREHNFDCCLKCLLHA